MKKTLQRKMTFSNVLACLALFVALGGSAYAATQLPKNSVGPKQLKKNAVTTAKIKKGAVTGAKINLGSLGAVPTATNATNATNANNANALGGVGPSGYQKTAMWALVNQDGVILSQSGGISMQATNPGGYWMHFPQSVINKAIAVTPWEGWEPQDPAVEVAPCGGSGNPGGVDCVQGTNTTSDLFVGTQESGEFKKAGFYILVLP